VADMLPEALVELASGAAPVWGRPPCANPSGPSMLRSQRSPSHPACFSVFSVLCG